MKSDDKVSEAEQKTANFFKACKNIEKRNEIGLSELKRMLQLDIVFPLISDTAFDDSEYNWEKHYVYSDVKLYGVQPFFSNYITYDEETNYTTRILTVSPENDLYKYREILTSESRLDKIKFENLIRDRMKNVTQLLNPNIQTYTMNKDIDDVIEFGKKLGNASLLASTVYNGTKDYVRVDLYQMDYKFKKVKWFELFSELYQMAHVKLRKDDPILVTNHYYFTELGEILSSTSKRCLNGQTRNRRE
ncbi:neprilysin-11-like protein [Leptotrombidium deliense]|uniref:Neprilysin-11-like protein n=1 Tax=Leptotrombidium deliense TaxID=299467 RepID=A0A443SAP3_9ACAR|nr:neprilysin-11-like protein [Leptotrombidium deliense]